MNVFMCCGEESVRLSDTKPESRCRSKTARDEREKGEENSDSSLSPRSKGSSRRKRWKKWLVKWLIPWKKPKSNVILTPPEIQNTEEISCEIEQSRNEPAGASTEDSGVCLFREHEPDGVLSKESRALEEKSAEITSQGSAPDETNELQNASSSSKPSSVCLTETEVLECSDEKADASKTSVRSSSSSSYDSNNDVAKLVTTIEWGTGYEERLTEVNISNLDIDLINTRIFTCEEGEGEVALGDKLGEGGFGCVRMGQWTLQKINGDIMVMDVAVKIMLHKDLNEFLSVISEIKALTRCKHPNIVQLHFVVTSAERTYLGLELAAGGDLFTYIKENGAIPESQTMIWFRQIVEAVEYCHSNGIAHMDIKAPNVLIDDKNCAKLTDFGLSVVQPDPNGISAEQFLSKGKNGTIFYMAPEMFAGTSYDTRKCDVWSLGVLLYEMLTGDYPFPCDNMDAMYFLTEEDLAGSKFWDEVEAMYTTSYQNSSQVPVLALIVDMLRINMEERLTIFLVLYILKRLEN